MVEFGTKASPGGHLLKQGIVNWQWTMDNLYLASEIHQLIPELRIMNLKKNHIFLSGASLQKWQIEDKESVPEDLLKSHWSWDRFDQIKFPKQIKDS